MAVYVWRATMGPASTRAVLEMIMRVSRTPLVVLLLAIASFWKTRFEARLHRVCREPRVTAMSYVNGFSARMGIRFLVTVLSAGDDERSVETPYKTVERVVEIGCEVTHSPFGTVSGMGLRGNSSQRWE